MPTLHGINVSPFVRKVRVYMAEKGLPYDIEPVIPVNVSDEYKKMSPLGKIPAYRDGDVTLCDSSVICAYLERTHPEPALYPKDAKEYARALWYEEYADTKLLEAVTPPFVQRVVNPKFMNQPADEAAVKKALTEDAPPIFDYLEEQIGDHEYLVGNRFSIADIATASGFVNFAHGGETVDAGRWPKLAAYVERIHARPSFKALIEEEKAGIPG